MSEEEKKSEASAGAAGDEAVHYPPPVDFRLFCEGFVGQALMTLGKYPHPTTGETKVDLVWAKYFIDILGLLQTKTKGNLDNDEKRFLDSMLSMLRLTFVEEGKKG